MTASNAFRRMLAAVAIPLALAGCKSRSANSAQGSAAANETAGEATAHSRPTRTGYADVEGGRIYYQVHGDLKSGKTPLLVLPGAYMSGEAMQPFIDAFAGSRPVIAIDARGHGRTGDLPGPITYELMADDGAAVLAALNVSNADVLGYSMGGTTAIFMGIRHPNRVGKLVIVSGVSRRDGWYPEVRQALAKVNPAVFVGSPMEAEYRRLSPTSDKFPTLVTELAALLHTNYDRSNDAVRGIDDKTMIVVGDADGVELEHAIELFRLRGGGDRDVAVRGFMTGPPRARLAVLPATSHIGIMAEAERIATLVTPFLDDRGPPRPAGFFQGVDAPRQ